MYDVTKDKTVVLEHSDCRDYYIVHVTLNAKICASGDERTFLGQLCRIGPEGTPISNQSLRTHQVPAEDLHAESLKDDRLADERNEAVMLPHTPIEDVIMPRISVPRDGLKRRRS